MNLREAVLAAMPELTGLLDVFDTPALLISPDYWVLAANRAYRRDCGGGEPLCERRCYEVSHGYTAPCDLAGETCPLRQCLELGQPQRVLHVHHSPRGDEHVDVETVPIRGADGQVSFVVERMRRTRLASTQPAAEGMVGRAPAFNQMLERIHRVAPSRTTVLLLGESGTGKELVAQALHELSLNAGGPFVPVECSGLSETLFESELFGHERGAFTGAVARKIGLVEAARSGTLFLDEVGDIPLSQQVKLLRLLETGTYRPVGGVEARQADFRLVCATHRDLKAMMGDGSFRRDLYYRISAFPVRLPTLRERIEDLPLLAQSLLSRLDADRELRLDDGALACLRKYPFPGNIRELRNALEHAALMADGEVIRCQHLPEDFQHSEIEPTDPGSALMSLAQVERRYVEKVLALYQGDRQDLARGLGISERTLYRKLKLVRQARARTS
jgi:two-component system response regulator HydG